jgi:hypothetical protein
MGEPVTPDPGVPLSTDCPACTPDPFPVGATPRYIHVVFHNVHACPGFEEPQNDVPIEITNNDQGPCSWSVEYTYNGVDWAIYYDASVSFVRLVRMTPFSAEYFYAEQPPCAHYPFTNIDTCAAAGGYGGSAVVLGLPVLYVELIAKTYGFMPDVAALYDIIDSVIPGYKTIRLSRGNTKGSCLFQFDPGAI